MPNNAQEKCNGNEIADDKKKVFDPGIQRILWGASGLLIVLLVFTFTQRTGRVPFFTQNFLSLVVLVVIAIQAYIYRGQWQAMQDSLERTDKVITEMEQQRTLAETSAIIAQRAYVVAKVRGIGERDNTLQFRLRIQNGGNTPANNVCVSYICNLYCHGRNPASHLTRLSVYC